MAEEYLLGEMSTETHYNPNAVPPTWAEYYSFLVNKGIDSHVIVPVGKLGSDKRIISGVSRKVTRADVEGALRTVAEQLVAARGIIETDPNYAAEVFATSAVIMHDPNMSARIVEVLCVLSNSIVHLTGLVIKTI